MKNALVLGTNAGQADLIRHLADAGWSVTACAQKAGGAGERYAQKFEPVNITDMDGVERLARESGAELVYSASSDIAVRSVVEVSRRLGLPHYFDQELVALLDSKPRLRAFLNERNLSPVPFAEIRDAAECAGWDVYPCIVKPADAQGSRGVRKLSEPSSLVEAVTAAMGFSNTGAAIVEKYLAGVEISFNVLVVDGEAVVNQPSERLVHPEPLVGIPSGHLIPVVNLDPAIVEQGAQLVRDVVKALGIDRGTLYFQMKASEDGPKIVEIAPRLDGCHIWRLMTHAVGVNFLDVAVRGLLGETIAAPQPNGDAAVYELQFQQQPPGGVFRAADFPAPADALYHEHRYEDGDTVSPINGQMEVVGYYVRRWREDERTNALAAADLR